MYSQHERHTKFIFTGGSHITGADLFYEQKACTVDQHWVQNDALLHTVYYATQHDGLQHDETPLPPQKCMYLFRVIEHRLHNETILQIDPILTKGL